MGSTLSSIVRVNIDLANIAVQQKGFGRMLIVGSSNHMDTDLFRVYTSLAGMVDDGFLTTDPEYKAALAAFSQEKAPEDVMIGYMPDTDVAQIDKVSLKAAAQSNHLYAVSVNGVLFTFESDADATVAEITAGLIAAVNGGSEPVTASQGVAGEVILTGDEAGVPFTTVPGADWNIAHTTLPTTGDITDGMNAIIAAGGADWYALVVTHTRLKGDILAAAAWIESASGDYIYAACSADADVLTSATDDVLSELKALGYLRTFYLWSDAQAAFPEAAWLGDGLPRTPGSSNWAYKQLIGITPTTRATLTDSKITILEGKNGNYYMTVAGVGVTQTGKMVGSEWVDVIIGRDWLVARIQEEEFRVLVQSPKVPFTDNGIGMLSNVLSGVLQQGVENGILETFEVQTPLATSFSSAERASRRIPGIPFTGRLKGAINEMDIDGTVAA